MTNTKQTTKNLTVTLNLDEHADLDFLVNYFQQQSISTVTKSDVIKFMIRQMKKQAKQELVNQVNALIAESEAKDK